MKELLGVIHLLPQTAAADAEVFAFGSDSMLGLLGRFDDSGSGKVATDRSDLGIDELAGNPFSDKDDKGPQMSDAFPFRRHGLKRESADLADF